MGSCGASSSSRRGRWGWRRGWSVTAFAKSWGVAAAGHALALSGPERVPGDPSRSIAMQLLPNPGHRGHDLGILNLTNTLPAMVAPLLALALGAGEDRLHDLAAGSSRAVLLGRRRGVASHPDPGLGGGSLPQWGGGGCSARRFAPALELRSTLRGHARPSSAPSWSLRVGRRSRDRRRVWATLVTAGVSTGRSIVTLVRVSGLTDVRDDGLVRARVLRLAAPSRRRARGRRRRSMRWCGSSFRLFPFRQCWKRRQP